SYAWRFSSMYTSPTLVRARVCMPWRVEQFLNVSLLSPIRLIMQDNNACFECFGIHECELQLLSSFGKQPLPTSQNHRMNHTSEFINQIMLYQCVYQFPTPSNQNILTWLLFQFLYLLHNFLADDG